MKKSLLGKCIGGTLAVLFGFSLFSSSVSAASFSDVDSDFWAEEELEYLTQQDIINGYSNGKFGVNDSVQRDQAAAILVRTLDLDTGNASDPGFEDVRPGDSFYNEIAAAVEAGIFQEADHFNPGDTLTRAQMAKVLTEAFNLESHYPVSFRDIHNDFWAYDYVDALMTNHITTGYPNFTFRPTEDTTRTQFSVFLARIIEDDFITVDSIVPNEYFTYTYETTENGTTNRQTLRSHHYDWPASYDEENVSKVWRGPNDSTMTGHFYYMGDEGLRVGYLNSEFSWVYKNPLESGNVWYTYDLGSDEPTGTGEIVSTEKTITTSAGTFTNVVEIVNKDYNNSFESHTWHAPGFGQIRTEGWAEYSTAQGGLTRTEWENELIDINPDPRRY